jgi:sulfur-oxidizing protein SoxZ
MGKMRIKAKEKKGIVTVKAMAKHLMTSYAEAKKKHKKANFITNIVAKVDGKIVYELSSSQFLSKNPYFKFKFSGSKGGKVEVTWTDLSGKSQTGTAKIK